MKIHPARFPAALPKFFIRLVTKPDELVLDPFAGSNATGQVAESLAYNLLREHLFERVYTLMERGEH